MNRLDRLATAALSGLALFTLTGANLVGMPSVAAAAVEPAQLALNGGPAPECTPGATCQPPPCSSVTACPPPTEEPDPECGETVTWVDATGKPHTKYGGDCPPEEEPDPECGETATWVDATGKPHTKYGGDCPPPPGEEEPDPECGETATWVDAAGKPHSKYGGDCPPPPDEDHPDIVTFDPDYTG